MAVHLYGIVPAGIALPDRQGRAGAQLRVVAADGIGVLVSDVDEGARTSASDLLAHSRVLEDCVVDHTVVPMQFGVLLADDESVRRDLLLRDRPMLQHLLRTFDGMIQLSVRILQEEGPALREVLARHPDLLALQARVRETVPPAPVSTQLELGEGLSRALTELASGYASAVRPVLDQRATATAEQEPQGVNEVLNAAYLVARKDQLRFDEAVGSIRETMTGHLIVRYVGPQPPYSFVEAAREGTATWA